MVFPNYSGKHRLQSIVAPKQTVDDTIHRRGAPPIAAPRSVVITYSRGLLADAVSRYGATLVVPSPVLASVYAVDVDGQTVALVGGFGIGAPAVTIVLEELIAAWGVRHIFTIGAAGGLDHDLRPGDIVLCTGAVRDEGVSHHYAPSEDPAVPDQALTDRLDEELRQAGVTPRRGRTWTIDAPYRETLDEAHHYRDAGVLTVEMEAAAVFIVAAYRGVSAASAFFVTDLVLESGWDTHFGREEVIQRRNLLTDTTLAVAAATI